MIKISVFLFNNSWLLPFYWRAEKRVRIRFIRILWPGINSWRLLVHCKTSTPLDIPSKLYKARSYSLESLWKLCTMYPKVAKDVLYLILAAHRLNFRARILQGGGRKGENKSFDDVLNFLFFRLIRANIRYSL